MLMSIIVGAIAGWIASIIMKKNNSMGAIANIIVGLIGGAIGRFVLKIAGFYSNGKFIPEIIVGVIGAVILLAIVNAVKGRR